MKKATLYELSVGGSRYIGVTTLTIAARLRLHRAAAKKGSTALVHESMRSSSEETWVIKALVVGREADMHELERKAIEEFGATEKLLNEKPGGKAGFNFKHKEGVGAKISAGKFGLPRPDLAEKNRARKGRKGTPHTDEWKKANGERMKFYWQTRRSA